MSMKTIAFGLFMLVLVCFFAGFSLLFQGVWNSVMPEVFGLPLLSFGQAFALFTLLQIVSGSIFGITATMIKTIQES